MLKENYFRKISFILAAFRMTMKPPWRTGMGSKAGESDIEPPPPQSCVCTSRGSAPKASCVVGGTPKVALLNTPPGVGVFFLHSPRARCASPRCQRWAENSHFPRNIFPVSCLPTNPCSRQPPPPSPRCAPANALSDGWGQPPTPSTLVGAGSDPHPLPQHTGGVFARDPARWGEGGEGGPGGAGRGPRAARGCSAACGS